ncbi:MAG TPA: alkaline phosphatase family protein [Pirellulales bacterium]|nr:alkaline phosphatase family protein [Pirellulales bacterium]
MSLKILAACALVLLSSLVGQAAERPASRVLVIGIDGCRADALKVAKIPHLKALIDVGAFSEATNIVGTRGDTADTVSGPGWSNVLTGVWADKHGVTNNNFEVMHYDAFPHFFTHVKEAYPGAKTYSYCVWPPIHEKIVRSADETKLFARAADEGSCAAADTRCAAQAVETLTKGDPDAMFVYLENVDDTGHRKGFHPTVPDYVQALEEVDGKVGQVIDALHARPNYAQENWLVIVATDHGGVGTGHGGGRMNPEVNTVFLIVSGADAAPGKIAGPTNHVDVVATALTHLGIAIKPEWGLDGHAVGLKADAGAKAK